MTIMMYGLLDRSPVTNLPANFGIACSMCLHPRIRFVIVSRSSLAIIFPQDQMALRISRKGFRHSRYCISMNFSLVHIHKITSRSLLIFINMFFLSVCL